MPLRSKLHSADAAEINMWELSNLKVEDLMTSDVLTLFQDDNLKTLEDLMEWMEIRHVPVIDEEKHLIGLITRTDFLKITISELADINQKTRDSIYFDIPVKKIMGKKLETAFPETPLFEAAEQMRRGKFGCLPVVDDQSRLKGILTESDFVRFFQKLPDALKTSGSTQSFWENFRPQPRTLS